MVYIPGGEFLMGSPSGEGCDREKPQHQVRVSPFYMGKFPVTQEQWKTIAKLPQVKRELKLEPSKFTGKNQLPVERVSWDDAVEFCQRLSKQTGNKYRLPSEAEWEYACRARTTTPFHFGEKITDKLANYGKTMMKTTSVGKFPPNAFGLYDMHGNVWEWCQDNWHNNYESAPKDGSAWISSSTGLFSWLFGGGNIRRVAQGVARGVARGGSWYDYPDDCRSAFRSVYARDGRDLGIGFRVVRVAPRVT